MNSGQTPRNARKTSENAKVSPEGLDDVHAFRELIARVNQGSEEAAWELIERYGDHILQVVRYRLNQQIRVRYDSMDFFQSVWAAFFIDRERICSFQHPSQLIAFLATIAHRKVISRGYRQLLNESRNINRCQPMRDMNGEEIPIVSSEPSPLDVAIAKERWQQLLAAQPARSRVAMEMRLDGASNEEIAAHLGTTTRTVRRMFERLDPGAAT